jgi:hypothetical protein
MGNSSPAVPTAAPTLSFRRVCRRGPGRRRRGGHLTFSPETAVAIVPKAAQVTRFGAGATIGGVPAYLEGESEGPPNFGGRPLRRPDSRRPQQRTARYSLNQTGVSFLGLVLKETR